MSTDPAANLRMQGLLDGFETGYQAAHQKDAADLATKPKVYDHENGDFMVDPSGMGPDDLAKVLPKGVERSLASVMRLFNADQVRDDHGRWSGDGGGGEGGKGKGGGKGGPSEHEVSEATRRAEEGLRKYGGFSLRPPADVPTDGYMVSLEPNANRGLVFDMHAEELGKGALHAAVRGWVAREMSAIEHTPNYYLGGWIDKGKLHLDVSERFGPHDHDAAAAAGRARDQIEIWDVANSKGIPTGGSGGMVTKTSIMATLAAMDRPPPPPAPADPGKRELILPPSREYTPKQVADHVVEVIEKYRAAHGLPPMKP